MEILNCSLITSGRKKNCFERNYCNENLKFSNILCYVHILVKICNKKPKSFN